MNGWKCSKYKFQTLSLKHGYHKLKDSQRRMGYETLRTYNMKDKEDGKINDED